MGSMRTEATALDPKQRGHFHKLLLLERQPVVRKLRTEGPGWCRHDAIGTGYSTQAEDSSLTHHVPRVAQRDATGNGYPTRARGRRS